MTTPTLDVDYLIIGGGAVGMAFADSLLTETEASQKTIAIVDRHHRPGGHWNDAYPFVRLHQPSSSYGVSSRPLGTGAKDEVGHNKGMFELASGQEVLSHFDLVMQQRFLTSGRVHWFPMSDASDDGTVTSLLSGETTLIRAQKVVDATHSKMQVPSMHKPSFTVAREVAFIPLNALPRVAQAHDSYVVIGAGKTGMDAIIWLLDNGANPESIQWVMPRDSWLLRRGNFQPGSWASRARKWRDRNEPEHVAHRLLGRWDSDAARQTSLRRQSHHAAVGEALPTDVQWRGHRRGRGQRSR